MYQKKRSMHLKVRRIATFFRKEIKFINKGMLNLTISKKKNLQQNLIKLKQPYQIIKNLSRHCLTY